MNYEILMYDDAKGGDLIGQIYSKNKQDALFIGKYIKKKHPVIMVIVQETNGEEITNEWTIKP